jgi:radical SAM protein with 4Fe4S-binding SPASM domain
MITERIDNITRIPENYRIITPPAPKSVKIEVTGKCNYRCGFCPLMTRENPGRDMDWKFFKRITEEMITIGVQEIGVFFMGESFTSSDLLVKAIKHLKRIGTPYVFLTSNASVANANSVARVMKSGLDSLKWSVNIADKEQFKEIVGVKESLFEQALDNIKNAYELRQKRGYKTKLYASSIRYDDEQLVRIKKLLDTRVIPYVDQHYWLPLYSMGSLATAKEKELGMQPIAGNPGRYDNPVPPIPCWTLFTETHIMNDGRMTACCADATGEWVMGDLKTQSFMEAWHSEKFQELRKEHLSGNVIGTKCENCVIYK